MTPTATQESSPQARKAASPFDKPSADVILRTSDFVDFYVHKVVLSLASAFFEDMFQSRNLQYRQSLPV